MESIILIIGLPGSGKTTLANMLSKYTGYDYISSEVIRASLLNISVVNSDCDFSEDEQSKTYGIMCELINQSLLNRKSLIVEGVFRTYAQRESVYKLIEYYNVSSFRFLITCQESEAIKRIIRRKIQGTISPAGESTYYDIKKSFEIPLNNEKVIIIDNSHDIESAFSEILLHLTNYSDGV